VAELWTLVSGGDATLRLEEKHRDRIPIAIHERLMPLL
jgi:hypothetical protein